MIVLHVELPSGSTTMPAKVDAGSTLQQTAGQVRPASTHYKPSLGRLYNCLSVLKFALM